MSAGKVKAGNQSRLSADVTGFCNGSPPGVPQRPPFHACNLKERERAERDRARLKDLLLLNLFAELSAMTGRCG